jgi:hypothetical protein
VKRLLWLSFWINLVLAACSGRATPTIFIPAASTGNAADLNNPTSNIQPDSAKGISTPQPSPTPDCQSNLLYLEDITIPDGTDVNPSDSLDKRWMVENNGTCNWDYRFGLKLIAGPAMGADPEQALYPARSGNQVEVQIQFTAPQEPGLYRSAWQAADPEGKFFGDPIFIEINVLNP